MLKAVDQTTPLAIPPIYVERNPRTGNLFFRSCPAARKRLLPRGPTTAEFHRAYHEALVDAGEDERDDWSDLAAAHKAQREAKKARPAREHEPVTIERLERALAFCARLVVVDGPVVIPLFEKAGT